MKYDITCPYCKKTESNDGMPFKCLASHEARCFMKQRKQRDIRLWGLIGTGSLTSFYYVGRNADFTNKPRISPAVLHQAQRLHPNEAGAEA